MKAPIEAVFNTFMDAASIKNFRINSDGTLSKREGFYELDFLDGEVRATYTHENSTYIVSGASLWLIRDLSLSFIGMLPKCMVNEYGEKATIFGYGEKIYIIGGGGYYCYDTVKKTISEITPYAPLVTVDAGINGKGTAYESPNALTPNKKIRYIVDKTTGIYYLPEHTSSIIKITSGSYEMPSDFYTLVTDGTRHYINFESTSPVYDMSSFTVEYIPEPQEDECPVNLLSHTTAFLYTEDDDVRVLLYGKNTGGKIFISASSLEAGAADLEFNYFPTASAFTLKGESSDIRSILRFRNHILAVTANSSYRIIKSTSQSTKPYKPPLSGELASQDFHSTEKSGVVCLLNECYAFSEGGLLKLSYNGNSDSYLTEKIEIPEFMCPSRDDSPDVSLHIHKSRDELWCYYGGKVAVYSPKGGLWYEFTGIPAVDMFCNGTRTLFETAGFIYVFDENTYTDMSKGVDAVYESKPIDLGNIFKKKTIFSFGATIKNIQGAKLICTLKNDKDVTREISVESSADSDNPTTVMTTHARLGNTNYLTFKLVSPADNPPANVKSIMIRYR